MQTRRTRAEPEPKARAQPGEQSRSHANFAHTALVVLGELGCGGSAKVLHARDASGRMLALKVLRAKLAAHPRSRILLEREAHMLERVRHPHVVACAGLIEFRNRPALVLEYLEGGDLVSLAGEPPGYWLRAARDLLAALQHCHSRGVAHGDLRARNVLFDARNRAQLIDFTSAREATVQACADDVMAAAGVIYELLAGQPPQDTAGDNRMPAPREGRGSVDAMAVRPVAEVVMAMLERRVPPRLSVLADVIEFALELVESQHSHERKDR